MEWESREAEASWGTVAVAGVGIAVVGIDAGSQAVRVQASK